MAKPRPQRPRRRGWLTAVMLGLGLAVAAVYVGGRGAAPFESVEGQLLDWRFHLRGPQAPLPDTVLVMIDDATLEASGQWPLPRGEIATALNRLAADGAGIVAFDLLFLGKGTKSESAPVQAVDAGDRALAEAVAKAGTVIVPYAFLFDLQPAGEQALSYSVQRSAYRLYSLAAGERPSFMFHPTGIAAPKEYLLAPSVLGHVNIFLDKDGYLRHAHPVIGYGEDYFPSLPVQAARLALGLGPGDMAVEFGSGLRLGGRIIPTDGTMRIAVNYRGPARSFRTFSFGDLVVGRIPKGTFTGKLVLVGATALGVGDTFPSPFDEALPGVEYLATVIDNLRQGDALNHSQETAVLDLLILVALGLLFALLAALRQPTATLIAGAAIAAAVTVGNYLAFAEGNLWLNLTFPLASVVLCTAVLGFTNVMTAQREKAVAVRQRGAMSQYVAPWIADRVTSGEDTAAFPRALQAAVLFVDMRGFTALSESRGSAATAHLLHDYHRLVEEVVARHDGTIDKFMGDGAMALFGVPEPGERDPLNALACARDLAEALAQWGSAAEGAPIGFGIGLHFGPVAVDQTGGQRQLHLSVSGDTVNVASRLESLSATHGAAIIASDALMDMAEAQGAGALLAGFTRLPMQTVKGRERPIGVWALTAAGRPEEP